MGISMRKIFGKYMINKEVFCLRTVARWGWHEGRAELLTTAFLAIFQRIRWVSLLALSDGAVTVT